MPNRNILALIVSEISAFIRTEGHGRVKQNNMINYYWGISIQWSSLCC